MSQTDLTQFTQDSSSSEDCSTSNRPRPEPLPYAEEKALLADAETGDTIDKRALPETGLAPDDLQLDAEYLGNVAIVTTRDEREHFETVMESIHT